jgi:hypothetical protein
MCRKVIVAQNDLLNFCGLFLVYVGTSIHTYVYMLSRVPTEARLHSENVSLNNISGSLLHDPHPELVHRRQDRPVVQVPTLNIIKPIQSHMLLICN